MTTPVAIEVGGKRCFATALDWPGWCRSGRDEHAALENLVAYGGRYAAVVASVAPEFAPPVSVEELDVIEHLPGSSSTDFGAPASPPAVDADPIAGIELERLEAILHACWAVFDVAVERAAGHALATGPRGGGRLLDAIVAHVADSEAAYIAKLGARAAQPAALSDLRREFIAALEARARGDVTDTGPLGGKRWSARFAVRRSAWHTLDHAWEIEDRMPPAGRPA